MFDKVKALFQRDGHLHEQLAKLRQRVPVPLFWLFGKTQSGKTSVIKYLTGAEEAEIGKGFRSCTRFSRQYEFPTEEAALVRFLDTRGLDEPGYDPQEDLGRFNDLAHVVIVTVKAMDHAQENVLTHLRALRRARRDRPVILALTCLHEAYPQQQHPEFRFSNDEFRFSFLETARPASELRSQIDDLNRSLAEQRRRFEGLFDKAVPLDLTRPEEGFAEPNYGGENLKQSLLHVLPAAFRQTLLTLDEAGHTLSELYARQALPHIVGYSSLAASAGALPVPWIDLLLLPGIQTRMIYRLAELYGQPLSGRRFLELASTLGLGMLLRQAAREMVKFIPFVGSVASGALAGASTFALGKAFCFYYRSVHQGHVPKAEDLQRYYQKELAEAERSWKVSGAGGMGGQGDKVTRSRMRDRWSDRQGDD